MSLSLAQSPCILHEANSLSPAERELVGGPMFDNFELYAQHPSPKTKLFFLKVYRDDHLLGVAPVIKLIKHRSTELLVPRLRRWLGPLIGWMSGRTTYMVDSAFMAYDHTSPFHCSDPVYGDAVRTAVSEHLRAKSDAQTVWLMLAESDLAWAQSAGYFTFGVLPMVHVETAGLHSLDEFVDSLPRKRRRSYRRYRQAWETAGATLETSKAPLDVETIDQMHACLENSAASSRVCVPHDDVMIDLGALAQQKQTALIARVGRRVIGFTSYLEDGPLLRQCHGGVDYDHSLRAKAYHNLMYEAIGYAIGHGFERVTFGPNNNETKRRVGRLMIPMAAGLWCRNSRDFRWTRWLFHKNFQVYTGPAEPQSQEL